MEGIFSCAYWPFIYLLWKIMQTPCPVLIELFLFLLFSYRTTWCIMAISLLLDTWFENIFSYYMGYVFIFSMVFLEAKSFYTIFSSVQFSSVAQSCPTLCDSMNRSTPGLSIRHQLPEVTQTHVPRVGDAIQPSHPRSSPSPPAPGPSQHQSLFQWVNSSHEVAKVLEFQL